MGYEDLYAALRKDADERSDYMEQMNNALAELEMRANRSDPEWESSHDPDEAWRSGQACSEATSDDSMGA